MSKPTRDVQIWEQAVLKSPIVQSRRQGGSARQDRWRFYATVPMFTHMFHAREREASRNIVFPRVCMILRYAPIIWSAMKMQMLGEEFSIRNFRFRDDEVVGE